MLARREIGTIGEPIGRPSAGSPSFARKAMRLSSLSRLPTLLAATVAATLSSAPIHAQAANTAASADTAELIARTGALAEAFLDGEGRLRGFFPQRGSVTYVHTEHLDGRDSVVVRAYPAASLFSPTPPASLLGVLDMSYERQPVGLFVHQMKSRQVISPPLRWKRVGATRVVPADEPANAPFFVEWRREGGRWVVSAFGDEGFQRVPKRKWCC